MVARDVWPSGTAAATVRDSAGPRSIVTVVRCGKPPESPFSRVTMATRLPGEAVTCDDGRVAEVAPGGVVRLELVVAALAPVVAPLVEAVPVALGRRTTTSSVGV